MVKLVLNNQKIACSSHEFQLLSYLHVSRAWWLHQARNRLTRLGACAFLRGNQAPPCVQALGLLNRVAPCLNRFCVEKFMPLQIDILLFSLFSVCIQEDFKPVLQELLAIHPGLEFLQGTPEFQERYGEEILLNTTIT